MADLLLIETGNGGDLVKKGQDLALVDGYENLPYLAMFSGSDWWGNALLLQNDPSLSFLSKTEAALKEVALTSAGRIRIEEAVKADLSFLKKEIPGTDVIVTVSIVSPDRLEIKINIGGEQFFFAWNPDSGFITYQV